MKKYYSFYLFLLLIVSSCDNKTDQLLIGTWSIDTIIENDYEILGQYGANLIGFNKNNTCYLPRLLYDKPQKEGKWILEDKDSIIILNVAVENNKLSGTYRLKFWKDYDKKLLKMTLESENITLTCTKALYNFGENKNW